MLFKSQKPQTCTYTIRLIYFSDVLCVWAYLAQIRLDELKLVFNNRVSINFHFMPVFGNARSKIENQWCERGGLAGYSNHVQEIVSNFDHVTVHPDIWTKNIPHSSTTCHLFLRAIKLLEDKGLVKDCGSGSIFEKTVWAFREAFFTRLVNISERKVQFEIAEELGLPLDQIEAQIESGEAYAELSKDFELVKEHTVTVSPTLIFNEGRQRLNGNVGYRIIEANIRELFHNPINAQSWC